MALSYTIMTCVRYPGANSQLSQTATSQRVFISAYSDELHARFMRGIALTLALGGPYNRWQTTADDARPMEPRLAIPIRVKDMSVMAPGRQVRLTTLASCAG